MEYLLFADCEGLCEIGTAIDGPEFPRLGTEASTSDCWPVLTHAMQAAITTRFLSVKRVMFVVRSRGSNAPDLAAAGPRPKGVTSDF